MPLLTERLSFRPLERGDLEHVLPLFQDHEVMRFAVGGTRDDIETLAWITRMRELTRKRPGLGFRLGFDAEGCVGHVGLLAQQIDGRECIEVAYWLRRSAWGKGYATEAARAFRDRAFDTLGRDEVVSIIHRDNEASKRVALRIGMSPGDETLFKGVPVQIFRMDRRVWQAERDT